MNYSENKKIVMTLDAGGTNFVFSAIQGNEQIVDEIILPSFGNDLTKCISNIVSGFEEVKAKLQNLPVAISFAFPGPADYPNGIIGDLQNLPAFQGGVALGPMLSEKFGLPVFINNDGDLYAYGEALAGYLPYLNNLLEQSGSPKKYKNLLGLTLGTGFGAGIVHDGKLFIGDNSIAGEIWLLRDKLSPNLNIEEHASIRAVKNIYKRKSGLLTGHNLSPKDIYEIAVGKKEGNKQAALETYREIAEATGDAIANAVTLIDGIVVIGGGLSGASEIFLPYLIEEMNGDYSQQDGTKFRRLTANIYNLEDEDQIKKFLQGTTKEIQVYGSDKKIKYDTEMRIGVGISKIGTSKAISLGAYAFALNALEN